jgi:hypothetical protein
MAGLEGREQLGIPGGEHIAQGSLPQTNHAKHFGVHFQRRGEKSARRFRRVHQFGQFLGLGALLLHEKPGEIVHQ